MHTGPQIQHIYYVVMVYKRRYICCMSVLRSELMKSIRTNVYTRMAGIEKAASGEASDIPVIVAGANN